MKPNHYARKKRQLKILVEKLKYFKDSQNEDSLDQFKKLLAKIKNLVHELVRVISKSVLIKILGAAAILIGISFANPSMAQSFGPPEVNPFGLVTAGGSPALADLDGDGDMDLLVGRWEGHIEYFENIGSATNPQFGVPQMNPFGLDSSYLYSYGVFSYAFPSFVDLDDDGDMDLLIGGWVYENPYGNMLYFENIGDSLNPQFDVPQTNPFGLVGVLSLSNAAVPAFADLDGDGDCDLLVGEGGGGYVGDMYYFENTGSSANPLFSEPQQNPFGLVPTYSGPSPSFADLDEDGDIDLLVVEHYYGVFSYYENIGDSLNPQFDVPQWNPFGLLGVGWTANPAFADLEGDGDEDLVVGSGNNIVYFENTTGDGECPPGMTFTSQAQIDSLHANYPNCTEIKGYVDINGSDITNLNGLNVITAIWGTFTIGNYYVGCNPGLVNLTGLQNLDSIGGGLRIKNNIALTSITGINNLSSITGDIEITDNSALSSLTGLENLNSITGWVHLQGNSLLTNLTGLNNITSIGEDLVIEENNALASLAGLHNLSSIGHHLWITGNTALTSLTELDNLTSMEGDLWISGNESLTSLTGLNNITSVGEYLVIEENDALTSLTGLDNMTSIGHHLWITGNTALTSLTGLDNVTSIGGDLNIYSNDALTSLTGLDYLNSIAGNLTIGGGNASTGNPVLADISSLGNLDAGSINNLYINYNTSLSTCEVQSICDYLIAPNGTVEIHDNAPGCNSQQEVQEACDALNCLPEGITFSTQEEIDNFQVNYSGCIEIDGDVTIYGDDINDLSGLEVVKTIGGDLKITSNDSLTSLTGLDDITAIGGELQIIYNTSLTDLTGLENIEPGSISDLSIYYNFSLSECEVWSICQYLNALNGTIEIHDNASGCNSQQQVQGACYGVTIGESNIENTFTISPNPLESTTTISYTLQESSTVTLRILDLSGREMVKLVDEVQQQGEQKVVFNTADLPAGIYFCVLKTNPPAGGQTKKMIKL